MTLGRKCTSCKLCAVCIFVAIMLTLTPILVSTLQDRKNFLVPCHSFGIVLDILGPLASHLVNNGWDVPIYFLAPSASYVLKAADVSSEWYASNCRS